MIINSIEKNNGSAFLRERLKRRDEGVFNRQKVESSVGLKENYEDISGRVMRDDNSAALSFKGRSLLGSKTVGKILQSIENHNQTANAVIALVMAGFLRPGITMSLNLKERKDKWLPAIHSLSSAVLGLAVTMGITQPIDAAIQKATKNPEKFGNAKFLEIQNEIEALSKAGKKQNAARIKDLKKQQETMKLISRNIPEWIICIPRAMLTVALVPMFMKMLAPSFEKLEAKHAAKKEAKNTARNAENSDNKVNFKAKPDAIKKTGLYDKLTDWLAKKLITPFMNTKLMKKKSWDWRNNDFLYDGMATISSFAISSTYAVRSYKNKKIDDDKKNRTILALNHMLTWAISTAISFLTIKKLSIWWQRHPMAKLIEKRTNVAGFAKKYAQKHQELLDEAQKVANKSDRHTALRDARNYSAQEYFEDFVNENGVNKDVKDMLGGLKLFQKQLVWGTVTRLLVPLCSTIIASKLGRKAIAKREAKKEAALQAELAQQQMVFGEQKENIEKAAA